MKNIINKIKNKWLSHRSQSDTKTNNSEFWITVGLYMGGLVTVSIILYNNIGYIYHILVITNTLLFNKYISDKIKIEDKNLLVNIIWNAMLITVLNITCIWGVNVVEGLWDNNITHCDGEDSESSSKESEETSGDNSNTKDSEDDNQFKVEKDKLSNKDNNNNDSDSSSDSDSNGIGPGFIQSPLDPNELHNPLISVLETLFFIDFVELLMIIVLICFSLSIKMREMFNDWFIKKIPNRFIKIKSFLNRTIYLNDRIQFIVFIFVGFSLILIKLSAIFMSYTVLQGIDDLVYVYNQIKK